MSGEIEIPTTMKEAAIKLGDWTAGIRILVMFHAYVKSSTKTGDPNTLCCEIPEINTE